ncbi:MAG: penicillin-binding protein activator LpoB [Candidatus Omnitrophota bacterium]
MKKEFFKALGVLLLLCFVLGCGGTSVKRYRVDKQIDLSGRWNDTDSRLVAEEMIKDCLMRPWRDRFFAKNKREPVVIVDTVSNKSHEHISSQVFTKDLERSLINSGEIKFVASRDERKEVRTERDDQQAGLTAKETVKQKGLETGADFMLQGSINSVKDEIKGRYVILYQVNLELIDLTSNEKVWLGQKEIKKFVKKGKLSL